MRHHGKTPLGDSNMCKKCLLEAKRHHTNTTYIPKWQKTTPIPKPNHKCIHPHCKASEKLIHASFEHIEKLESALGVTSSPDNPFLLCRDHYNEMYRKFHPQTLCASCGATPKPGTSFSRHSPDAFSVSLYLGERTPTVQPTDCLCSTCYKLHLSIMKAIESDMNQDQSSDGSLMEIWNVTYNDPTTNALT